MDVRRPGCLLISDMHSYVGVYTVLRSLDTILLLALATLYVPTQDYSQRLYTI
jgi:hypothetical protein